MAAADPITPPSPLPPKHTPPVGAVMTAGLLLLLVTAWAVAPLLDTPTENASGPTGVRVDPGQVYNPVLGGERLPDGFRQVLPRDAILPVYDPEFVPAIRARWEPDTQVIGVEIDGQARAYPVSFLNGREMVIDTIADVPIVVTW